MSKRAIPSGDERVCALCTKDPFLAETVREDGEPGACSYCSEENATLTLREFADLLDDTFQDHFEPSGSAPFGGHEWDFRPTGEEPEYVLQEMALIDEPLANDVVALLRSAYGYAEHHDGDINPYSDDHYYLEKDPEIWGFRESWAALCEDVRTRSRFFSRRIESGLREIFGDLAKHETSAGGGVIRTIDPDTDDSLFYRARVAFSHAELNTIIKDPVRELGPPPSKHAKSGRMNAAGISVFYGATSAEVCVSEVRPPVGSNVVVGRFSVIRRLSLLDLDALTDIFEGGFHFDPDYKHRRGRAGFMHSFVAELTRPVMPQDQDYEYLPTQVVAEYLAASESPALDGVLFKSSQTGGAARNVTLFNHASSIMAHTLPPGTDVQVVRGGGGPDDDDSITIFEEVPPKEQEAGRKGAEPQESDDLPVFGPLTLHIKDQPEEVIPVNPALRLDVQSLEVHDIAGVEYRGRAQKPKRYRTEKRQHGEF